MEYGALTGMTWLRTWKLSMPVSMLTGNKAKATVPMSRGTNRDITCAAEMDGYGQTMHLAKKRKFVQTRWFLMRTY